MTAFLRETFAGLTIESALTAAGLIGFILTVMVWAPPIVGLLR